MTSQVQVGQARRSDDGGNGKPGSHGIYPLVMSKWLLKMAIEIVVFPIKNGGSFHSYVKLPEGMEIGGLP